MTQLDASSVADNTGLNKQKYVHIETWGCQMNVADSERMLALLAKQGYLPVSKPDTADLIILNTCNIREKARHKVLTRLGELKRLKKRNPNVLLAISGCVAQVEAKELAEELPFVDVIFGPDNIESLPSLLSKAILNPKSDDEPAPLVDAVFDIETTYSIPFDAAEPWMGDDKAKEPSRFVNIIKGCNNFCTYCVVPYTRGREKSRDVEEIEQEIRFLLNYGVKEIVLLGQNVNSYGLDFDLELGNDKCNFVELLYRVAEIKELKRLRFVTSNPHDLPDNLPKAFADIPILCDQLHLPVQCGDDSILLAMNRKYTRAQYLDKLAKIREVRPDIAISSDFIVGFPGETDENFENTLSLVREAKFAFIFAFKYSPRKNTEAAKFEGQISEEVKDLRLQKLLSLQKAETERQNFAEIGKEQEILIIYKSQKLENTWFGRTFAGRLVKVRNFDASVGQTLVVKIVSATAISLEGVVNA